MAAWLDEHIRVIPDHPEPGVLFKDLTPMMAQPKVFDRAVGELAELIQPTEPELILGIEARGFIFGAPVAQRLGIGFVPVRKAGKLPADTVSVTYDLEYGTDTLEMHRDSVTAGSRVAVVDDVLATGGTARAVTDLVDGLGATTTALAVVIELAFLGGRSRLGDLPVEALVVEAG
ncbi:MAG: adenine phosphoribosyltransferase [Actinomycetota bacterium]